MQMTITQSAGIPTAAPEDRGKGKGRGVNEYMKKKYFGFSG
jgi:hypothetical protein